VHALPGHPDLPGDVHLRAPVEDHRANQQTAAVEGQPGITVRHEGLRRLVTA
jgi:hypothetical protein